MCAFTIDTESNKFVLDVDKDRLKDVDSGAVAHPGGHNPRLVLSEPPDVGGCLNNSPLGTLDPGINGVIGALDQGARIRPI